jgi:hypothetical protein
MNNKIKSISHRSFGHSDFAPPRISSRPSITAAPDCRCLSNGNYTLWIAAGISPRHLARWLPSKGLQVVRQYLEIQPWARGGGKTRMLRWLCAACDFLVRGGDEHYTIAIKPVEASL